MTNLRRRTSSPGGTWQSQRPVATTQAEVTGLPRLNGTRARIRAAQKATFPATNCPRDHTKDVCLGCHNEPVRSAAGKVRLRNAEA